jgi:hypothetical protein
MLLAIAFIFAAGSRSVPAADAMKFVVQPVDEFFDYSLKHIGFGGKVIIESALGDPNGFDDIRHRGLIVSLFDEQLFSRLDQLLPAFSFILGNSPHVFNLKKTD